MADRFCVLATVEDHVAKLNELQELGADRFNVHLMHEALEETLDAYGRGEIVPTVANALESKS